MCSTVVNHIAVNGEKVNIDRNLLTQLITELGRDQQLQAATTTEESDPDPEVQGQTQRLREILHRRDPGTPQAPSLWENVLDAADTTLVMMLANIEEATLAEFAEAFAEENRGRHTHETELPNKNSNENSNSSSSSSSNNTNNGSNNSGSQRKKQKVDLEGAPTTTDEGPVPRPRPPVNLPAPTGFGSCLRGLLNPNGATEDGTSTVAPDLVSGIYSPSRRQVTQGLLRAIIRSGRPSSSSSPSCGTTPEAFSAAIFSAAVSVFRPSEVVEKKGKDGKVVHAVKGKVGEARVAALVECGVDEEHAIAIATDKDRWLASFSSELKDVFKLDLAAATDASQLFHPGIKLSPEWMLDVFAGVPADVLFGAATYLRIFRSLREAWANTANLDNADGEAPGEEVRTVAIAAASDTGAVRFQLTIRTAPLANNDTPRDARYVIFFFLNFFFPPIFFSNFLPHFYLY